MTGRPVFSLDRARCQIRRWRVTELTEGVNNDNWFETNRHRGTIDELLPFGEEDDGAYQVDSWVIIQESFQQ